MLSSVAVTAAPFSMPRRWPFRCSLAQRLQHPGACDMTDFSSLVSAPDGRFDDIERPYTPNDVERLRGSIPIEYSLARRGAERLWELLRSEDYVHALGALTGNQAMQMVRAGLKAI